MTATFDAALLGQSSWLDSPVGAHDLHITRWRGRADHADEVMLAACEGPTLDVGCGPGRLVEALTLRDVPAMGVDISAVAVRQTRARGGHAVRRDVFADLPGEGRWHHVLLADGNIGIGGDPSALLRRVRDLLRPGGTAVVEVDPPGIGLHRGHARLHTATARGHWFPWAWVDAPALAVVGISAGLTVLWVTHRAGRWFVCLRWR
jgi:SAM-dependent methyltransferase